MTLNMMVLSSTLIGCVADIVSAHSDATVLVQLGKVQRDGGVTYAFEKYQLHDQVEGKTKDGAWMPVMITQVNKGQTFNVHVMDEFPGYDLANVPFNLLRRTLGENQSDWLVDNTHLKHKGKGIFYRHEKVMANKSAEHAPWGTMVVGSDEGDGWVKVSAGYLPKMVHGATILQKRERKGWVAHIPEQFHRYFKEQAEEERKRREMVVNVGQTTTLYPPETFVVGEKVRFKTRKGEIMDGQISEAGSVPNSYNLVLRRDQFSVFPANNIPATRLIKIVGPHAAQPGESPVCQKDGCILIMARTPEGHEVQLHVSKKMKVDMLMKMACNKIKVDWQECLEHGSFSFKGNTLTPEMKILDTMLEEKDVVDFKPPHGHAKKAEPKKEEPKKEE